jgi:hypothetical protein
MCETGGAEGAAYLAETAADGEASGGVDRGGLSARPGSGSWSRSAAVAGNGRRAGRYGLCLAVGRAWRALTQDAMLWSLPEEPNGIGVGGKPFEVASAQPSGHV